MENKRKLGWLWLIVPTFTMYAAIIITSFWFEDYSHESNTTILGVTIAIITIMFAVIGIVFVFEDNRLVSGESKLWFIDAIMLFTIHIFGSVLIYITGNITILLFALVYSCSQTFIVTHYYFRELFDSKNEGKAKADKKKRSIARITFTIILLTSVLTAIGFMTIACQAVRSASSIVFYVVSVTSIIHVMLCKEVGLEN